MTFSSKEQSGDVGTDRKVFVTFVSIGQGCDNVNLSGVLFFANLVPM